MQVHLLLILSTAIHLLQLPLRMRLPKPLGLLRARHSLPTPVQLRTLFRLLRRRHACLMEIDKLRSLVQPPSFVPTIQWRTSLSQRREGEPSSCLRRRCCRPMTMGSSGRRQRPLLVTFWWLKLPTRTTRTLRCLLLGQMKLYAAMLNDFAAVLANRITQPGLLDALRGSEALHLTQEMARLPHNPKVTSQLRGQADRILQMDSAHLVEEQNRVMRRPEEIYYDQYG